MEDEEIYRGIEIRRKNPDGWTCKGVVWYFHSKDKLKRYVDKHLDQGTARVYYGGFLFK